MTGTLHRVVVEAVIDREQLDRRASRVDVVDFVLGQLGSLPRPVRLGVDAVGVLVGGVTAVARVQGDVDAVTAGELLRLRPVRLYVRLIRSLALFAAYEAEGRVAPR